MLYNLVTRLRQPCYHLAGWKQSSHNLVTTMCMVNNIVTTLSPSCYNLVTTLFIVHNLVAALSQSCYKVVQPCHFYMGKIDYQQSYCLDTYILVAQMYIATYTILSNRVAIHVVYHNKLNCLHHNKYYHNSNYVIVQLLCTDMLQIHFVVNNDIYI